MNEPEVITRPAGFICGADGCDSLGTLVKCLTCGWEARAEPDAENDGQMILGAEPPDHSPLDCLRHQRDHPRRSRHTGTAKQQRASRAYERIHQRHAPVRLVTKSGRPTCPRCGFVP